MPGSTSAWDRSNPFLDRHPASSPRKMIQKHPKNNGRPLQQPIINAGCASDENWDISSDAKFQHARRGHGNAILVRHAFKTLHLDVAGCSILVLGLLPARFAIAVLGSPGTTMPRHHSTDPVSGSTPLDDQNVYTSVMKKRLGVSSCA